jgi:multiple RNA-binding domain-containing protein 1
LFVRNLAFVTTRDELRDYFSTYGPIEECHLPVSKDKQQPLGTAYILFKDANDALEAYRKLDRRIFQGRILQVIASEPKNGWYGHSDPEFASHVLGKSDKAKGEVKKDIQKKSLENVKWAELYLNVSPILQYSRWWDFRTGEQEVNEFVGSLFSIGPNAPDAHGTRWPQPDAVASSIAKSLGTTKAALLEDDGINPAVKLALAETHLINETKQFFEDEGLIVTALAPGTPRAKNIILVKNIPFGVSVHELSDMFSPHGPITKILMPPAGVIAAIQFENVDDARKAFLPHRRLKDTLIYLEWGYQGMFKDPKKIQTPASRAEEETQKKLAAKLAEDTANNTVRDGPAEDDEGGSTLYIKNLSFSTTSESLTKSMSKIPGFSFAKIKTKPHPTKPEIQLSMGFAFVGFSTRAQAQRAMDTLQGFMLDGKAIQVAFANRGAEPSTTESKGTSAGGELKGSSKPTKLMVKNLPFEASRKDLQKLFEGFGNIKSLRIPKKRTVATTGTSATRGFGFVEFTTHAEAKRAMDSLEHTHLLGRHLKIQWNLETDGADVTQLREKVGRQWTGLQKSDEQHRVKKRKLEIGKGDEENDGLED